MRDILVSSIFCRSFVELVLLLLQVLGRTNWWNWMAGSFLEQMKRLVAQSCLTVWNPMDCSPPRLLCLWNSPSENIGGGSHYLLQGFFPAQGLNSDLLHCRQILYHRYKGIGYLILLEKSLVVGVFYGIFPVKLANLVS